MKVLNDKKESTELQVFRSEEFGSVRVVGDWENPKFCLVDVCRILKLSQVAKVVQRLDKGVLSTHPLQTVGGIQNFYFIDEDGLYDVILDSRKPLAKKFRKWITSEVLPSIRKTGGYTISEKFNSFLKDPDTIIEICQEWKKSLSKVKELQNTVEMQNIKIAELTSKATYYDVVLQSAEAIPISVIAKDYGYSGKAMNKLLNDLGIQYRLSGMWLVYQEYAKEGYTCTKTYKFDDGKTAMHTYWTQKGRLFLYEKLKQCGILPLIERKNINELEGIKFDKHGQIYLITD